MRSFSIVHISRRKESSIGIRLRLKEPGAVAQRCSVKIVFLEVGLLKVLLCWKKAYIFILKSFGEDVKRLKTLKKPSTIEFCGFRGKIFFFSVYLLRQLATEVYKSLNNLSPDFIKPFFTLKDMPYNLRNRSILNLPSAHTTCYGTNAVLFRACLMWNGLPNFMKESNSLIDFKTNIKTIRNIVCSCKICGRS